MDTNRLIEVLELAVLVVEKNGRLRKGELPRLSQVLLGNMMYREDMATAAAIAYDIDPSSGTLALRISNGWAPSKKTQPGPLAQGIMLCHDVVAAVHKAIGPEAYSLVRTKIHKKRWGDVAKSFPGRDGQSLREDYYTILPKAYKGAQEVIDDFNDFLKKNVVDVKDGVKMLS